MTGTIKMPDSIRPGQSTITITIDPRIQKYEMEKYFYSAAEVAKILNTSKMSVYRMIERDDLLAINVLGQYKIPVREFHYYLRSLGISLPNSRTSVHH